MTSVPLRPPNAFIRQLPKAELHLHLEGSVEPATLLELRKLHGDRTTLAEVESLYGYTDFQSFLMAFKAVSAHLRGADDYELITYRLMQRLKEENVLHAEVYVAVGVCLFRKQDFPAIFEGLERGRARGARDFGVSLLWIFDATRHFGVEEAQKVFELAARFRDRHVIGVGLGGDELKAPPGIVSRRLCLCRRPGIAVDGACGGGGATGIHLGCAQPSRRTHRSRIYRQPGCRLDRRTCATADSGRALYYQ